MALAEYGNALNIDTDGSGNPILVDPDSGDTIAIYDRASGGWQVTEIEAATGDFDSVNTDKATVGDEAEGNRALLYQSARGPSELVVIPESGDVVGSVLTLPSGSGDRAHFLVGNNNDEENFGGAKFEIDGQIVDLEAFAKGTGDAPTGLRVKGFPDGLLEDSPGSGGDPSRLRTITDGSRTAFDDAAFETITADGTLQTIAQRNTAGGLYVVSAANSDDSKRISDIVHFPFTSPTVVSGGINGSLSRSDITYDFNSSNLKVSISDGGATWDIAVRAIGGI